jgi:anti-anti-sigma factor
MPDTAFSATVRRSGGVPVIALSGDINGLAEGELNAAFGQAMSHNPTAVLLNFAAVSYINSTGIALIVGLLAQARKARVTVLVCDLSEHYHHIFSITRLADFMSIHEDEAEALSQAATT